jgi:hypothetical protein
VEGSVTRTRWSSRDAAVFGGPFFRVALKAALGAPVSLAIEALVAVA